jgi:hypothetical protein
MISPLLMLQPVSRAAPRAPRNSRSPVPLRLADLDPGLHAGRAGTLASASAGQAWVERRSVRKRIQCREDVRKFEERYTSPYLPAPRAWAFAGGPAYYTLEGAGDDGIELRRRTDPPLSFVPCS